jgi:hypothetical protein
LDQDALLLLILASIVCLLCVVDDVSQELMGMLELLSSAVMFVSLTKVTQSSCFLLLARFFFSRQKSRTFF